MASTTISSVSPSQGETKCPLIKYKLKDFVASRQAASSNTVQNTGIGSQLPYGFIHFRPPLTVSPPPPFRKRSGSILGRVAFVELHGCR
jgi:hypothetical protein